MLQTGEVVVRRPSHRRGVRSPRRSRGPLLADFVTDTVALGPGDLLAAGSGNHGEDFAGLVVDVELEFVDDDVDQGVPMGEADLQPLPGDLVPPRLDTRR